MWAPSYFTTSYWAYSYWLPNDGSGGDELDVNIKFRGMILNVSRGMM